MIIRNDPSKKSDEWYDVTKQISPDAAPVPDSKYDDELHSASNLRRVVTSAVSDAVMEHIKKDADMEKVQKKHTLWALSFTKRLVIIIVVFYILANIYVGWVMLYYQAFEFLGQVYDKISTLVEVAIFGYLVKAGAENVPKIIQSNRNNASNKIAGAQNTISNIARTDFPVQEVDNEQ